jgi:hypothetical protein
MTARLSVQLLAGLLCAPVALLVAQEHPRPPQQSQSQQLPQTKTGAPQAATMEASMTDVSAGLKKYIDNSTRKSADRKFHVRHQGKDLALDLIKIHDDRLSSLGGGKYFACVDMKGTDGRIYDIDFLMALPPGQLKVTETSVHKINGKPLYNWKEERGVWKRVRVS